MRPIGFAICNKNRSSNFTKGKIYPYYVMTGPYSDQDYDLNMIDDRGIKNIYPMYQELKYNNHHWFDFYHYPEFPENVKDWTEDDWFQYDLKYGE